MADIRQLFPNASPAFFARNSVSAPSPHPLPGGKAGNTLTAQKTHKTSKCELEWLRHLRRELPDALILHQCLTLPLTGGGKYTPDIVVINPLTAGIDIWEVKGGYRGPGWEQGYERYKRAAYEWQDGSRLRFHLAEKLRSGWKVADFIK